MKKSSPIVFDSMLQEFTQISLTGRPISLAKVVLIEYETAFFQHCGAPPSQAFMDKPVHRMALAEFGG